MALQSSTGKYANLTFELTVLFFFWEMSLGASSWDRLVSGGQWVSVADALSLGMHLDGPEDGTLGVQGDFGCSL